MSNYGHFKEEPILKIPIRQGLEVSIHGIPWNLTREEAEKVVAVVQAFAPKPPSPRGGR